MKHIFFISLLFFAINAKSQIKEIFEDLNKGEELVYSSVKTGCLTLTKSSIKQSYSDNCAKPISFTINNLVLQGNRIQLRITMHYYGDMELVGFLEVKDGLLIFSYGKTANSEQQVDKYKL
jgi:hypothetical protein